MLSLEPEDDYEEKYDAFNSSQISLDMFLYSCCLCLPALLQERPLPALGYVFSASTRGQGIPEQEQAESRTSLLLIRLDS
jgi:hypothetical protein